MILIFLVLQFAIPVILITWIVVKPPNNLLGFWIQVCATCSALLMAALIGIWIFPPWWMPFVYGLFFIVAIYLGLRRRRPFKELFPNNIPSWIVLTAFASLCGYTITGTIETIKGWNPPEIEIVDLSFPLEQGSYIVANGGNDIRINAHMKTMDTSVMRFRKWRGNAYGVDLVGISRFGFHSSGLQPSDPSKYYIYGTKVLAPCAGEIIAACNDLSDMQVPEIDKANMAGNYVIIRSAKADVVMAHFRQLSLKVTTGDRVEAGQIIGEVGNSGVSNEPHLHIHAQRPGNWDALFSGEPLPIRLDGRFLARNDRWQQDK